MFFNTLGLFIACSSVHGASSHHSPITFVPVAPSRKDQIAKDLKHVFAGTAAAALILTVGGGIAQAADVEKGERVFEQNCSSCHVGGSNIIAQERTLQKEALDKFIGLDSGNIQSFVQDGLVHRGALAFGSKISKEQYADVAAYVYDQAISDKW